MLTLNLVSSPGTGKTAFLEQTLREYKGCVILVTHDLGVVAETCDRVAVLRRGTKVADKAIKQSSPEEVTGLITGAIATA